MLPGAVEPDAVPPVYGHVIHRGVHNTQAHRVFRNGVLVRRYVLWAPERTGVYRRCHVRSAASGRRFLALVHIDLIDNIA
jgi:hypothetical protein